MKIAFCLYKFFPYGGLQRDFLHVVKECLKRNYEVIIYVMSWEGEKPSGVNIIKVPKKGFTNHTRNTNYYKWVSQDLKTRAVDCVFGFNKMPGLDIYYAADVCFAAKKRGRLTKLLPRYQHYSAFENAVFSPEYKTLLLMLTDKQIEDFKSIYHTQDSRFKLLPPGIALDRKWNEKSEEIRHKFRTEHNLSDQNIVIVQIGSDYTRKGVDRSLRAIASLPESIRKNIIYYVIGQDKIEKFSELAKKLHIEEQVSFLGSRDDVNIFLASADLFLHPARQEAAGIVLIEAIVAGVPSIITDICGYSSYITDSNSGIVLSSPFSQIDFNLALEKILTDVDALKDFRNNAIEFSNSHDLYSLPAQVVNYIEDYVNDRV
ncbi:glycosyltransferase family 4 protein [Providencia sneebia]|uniref:Glucosyltransferase I RfaG n=1 Tax=Providencia sneebia DSM 19967 TaxID=1141660 RepID=K8WYL4_9GAMM|nr:glycosyltransferase family 4 protein [Providencia sneebia]EKT61305.1 glucosyltransferase I RfaG [Providencia sneebia DSM 19967]